MTAAAAIAYAVFAAMLVVFQLALALGAPWGRFAMGGRWPGRLPGRLRVAAVGQAALIAGFAYAVLGHAGLAGAAARDLAPGWLIWVILTFAVLGAAANLATPSRGERMLWGPVALAMLASLLVVIFGG